MGLTTLTMVLGAGLKSPCADRSWVEERRGASGQCYSDIADLLRTEQLADGRLPYLERCDAAAKPCDEYPLVSMYVMRLTASWPGGGDPYTTFFWVNVSAVAGLRPGDHVVPRSARCGDRVVRGGSHAADLRDDELGSRAGGVRNGGDVRIPPAARGRERHPSRHRSGRQALPGAVGVAVRRRSLARPTNAAEA